ncbi:MAG: PilZ domain-containing protein [Endomicrobia bacterium]|nr:PilZ domain-containing protein [Endomicrobiia bacterium]MCL2144808.1 PilZ domain-containing protein [Endomicrobiia bacterium]
MREKRKYIRRFTAMNISCYNAENTENVAAGLLVNISKGGIGIESKKEFLPGEKLTLHFISPDGKNYNILTEILYMSAGGFGILYGARYCETNVKKFTEFNDYLLKYFNLY